jgi:hypothetical protein
MVAGAEHKDAEMHLAGCRGHRESFCLYREVASPDPRQLRPRLGVQGDVIKARPMLGEPRPPRLPAGHDREVDIERRKPPAQKRWVVERALSWFGRNLRLAKDFENLAETLATFVTVASIQPGLRRLVPCSGVIQ